MLLLPPPKLRPEGGDPGREGGRRRSLTIPPPDPHPSPSPSPPRPPSTDLREEWKGKVGWLPPDLREGEQGHRLTVALRARPVAGSAASGPTAAGSTASSRAPRSPPWSPPLPSPVRRSRARIPRPDPPPATLQQPDPPLPRPSWAGIRGTSPSQAVVVATVGPPWLPPSPSPVCRGRADQRREEEEEEKLPMGGGEVGGGRGDRERWEMRRSRGGERIRSSLGDTSVRF